MFSLQTLPLRPSDVPPEFREPAQPAFGGGEVLNRLTEREVGVLRLVAKGFTNKEIADRLGISDRTVGAHLGNILTKLRIRNRTQAALFALRWGIAPLP